MKVEAFITFTHDEVIQNIPFAFIYETMSSSYWSTRKRSLLMSEMFTKEELREIAYMKQQAYVWYLKRGVPDEVTMSARTLALWNKLAEFCYNLPYIRRM